MELAGLGNSAADSFTILLLASFFKGV